MWLIDNKIRAFIFLFVYWLAFNFMVLHTPFTVFNSPDVGAVNHVQYLSSNVNSLVELNQQDVSQKNWQAISLPDDWYKNHQNNQQIWYRANVNLEPFNEQVWAIYLPSVTHNAAVYINGIWVGQGGQFIEPVSRHHNKPLLFNFSSKLLKQGDNQIDIKVKAAYFEQGLLDQFYLAPESQLHDAYIWKTFIRVELVRWMTMAMYVLSLIIFAFWLARPQDAIYGLFSLELFIWATHNLNLFVSDIPVSVCMWEAMTMSTLGWTVVVMIFFNHRFVGSRNIKVEKIISTFSIFGVAIFFLPDIGSILHIGYSVWDAFVMIFGIYAIYHLIKVYRSQGNPDVFLMLVVGVPILVFGFHDILMINHFIDRRDGLTMQYSVIPSVILFCWFLVRRFVQSINKAENLAETLERRVNDKQLELQLQYKKLNLLEKEKVLAEERERLMRDMHDGIGGQLLSVVTLLQEQSGDVFKNVREKVELSLIDLRFVIDSLDPLLSDLPTLLGMMRMRLVDQLEAANIELEWAVTELPEIDNMSPRRSLHIMRIVQEAITNSIKHSGSDKMKLVTGVAEDSVFIEVIDYGAGFEISSVSEKQGRGVKNMRYRAQQLDAELEFRQLTKGTSVRLLLAVT